MKLLVTALLMLATTAAIAQRRYPVPIPHPYPIPYPQPFPRPLPEDHCLGERYDRALAATEAAAVDKLDRFAALKGVACELTESSFESAKGRCVDNAGELHSTLRMAFVVNCYTRDVSSRLRKTWIKYY